MREEKFGKNKVNLRHNFQNVEIMLGSRSIPSYAKQNPALLPSNISPLDYELKIFIASQLARVQPESTVTHRNRERII